MGTILLDNVRLVDGRRADILIRDKFIESVTDHASVLRNEPAADRVVDCSRFCAIPGLVNAHTHAAMTLVRGVGKGLPLQKWLELIWSIEANLDPESVYWGTRLAILEMFKCGVTTFNDMYWYLPNARAAVEDSGARALLNYVMLDGGDEEKKMRQREECLRIAGMSESWSDRVGFGVTIHADYTVCEDNMVWAGRMAEEFGTKLHVHISETEKEVRDDLDKFGMTPVQYFDSLGLINTNFIGAHGLWLTDEDIEILGSRGASIVHNINSNLVLSSGYKFKYNELRDAGVNVCIGTDGCASSDNQDVRESMKTMLLLQRAWRNDPQAMPLNELMDIATVNGARALGINAGRLEAGALADIALIDMHRSEFVPDINFLSNFILAANSSCVDTVICDGQIVMEGRKVAGEDEVLEKAGEQAMKLMKNVR